MKNTDQENLFKKYIAGKCTDNEKAIVEGWYLGELQGSTMQPSEDQLLATKRTMWKEIRRQKSRRPLFKWIAYAAAATIAVIMIYQFQFTKPSHQEIAVTASRPQKTLFASKIENSMLKLSDGTIVILEKGSRISLSASFETGKSREISLSGKAFFDVKHDAKRPFIIYSGDIKTTVLGTSFDIEAIPGAKEVKINVIRGKVKVENANKALGVLTKNMQIVYHQQSEATEVNQVDADKELAWNTQDLEFNDISLEDARLRLEQKFGFKIIVKATELGQQTFHYSMRATESPESFIKSICVFINASYTIDHQNKIISIQPLNQ